MKKSRIEKIDIARGIVTLLVVIGHLVYYEGIFYKIIYAFHMHFFFILSGYCTKLHRRDIHFPSYLAKQAALLLLPSFLYKIVLMVLRIYVCNTMEDVLTGLFLSYAIEWFCPALFLSSILLWCFHYLVKKAEAVLHFPEKWLLIAALLTLVGSTPVLIQCLAEQEKPIIGRSIFKWDSSMVAFTFVLIGYVLRKYNFIFRLKNLVIEQGKNVARLSLCLFCIALPIISYNAHVNIYDANFGRSDIFFYSIALILTGICLVIACSHHTPVGRNSFFRCMILALRNILIILGQHGLFIYFGHSILFQLYHKLLLQAKNLDWWPMSEPFSITSFPLKMGYFISGITTLLLLLEIYMQTKAYLVKMKTAKCGGR